MNQEGTHSAVWRTGRLTSNLDVAVGVVDRLSVSAASVRRGVTATLELMVLQEWMVTLNQGARRAERESIEDAKKGSGASERMPRPRWILIAGCRGPGAGGRGRSGGRQGIQVCRETSLIRV